MNLFFSPGMPHALVVKILQRAGECYRDISDEGFKSLLPYIKESPEVATTFFYVTLRQMAITQSILANKWFPTLHFTGDDVANMVLNRLIEEKFYSLDKWQGDCRWQFWTDLIYPQRFRDAMKFYGLDANNKKAKQNSESKKELRLNLLSLPVEYRLAIIDLLPDALMRTYLEAKYVHRLTATEIEETLGIDEKEQDALHKAAAASLRNIVNEEYRGIFIFETPSGNRVNIVSHLFPKPSDNAELSLGERVSIDSEHSSESGYYENTLDEGAVTGSALLEESDDTLDDMAQFLHELYGECDTSSAAVDFVHRCAETAGLTQKEKFVWDGRTAKRSSAEIADDWYLVSGKRITNANVDNAYKVAKSKVVEETKRILKTYGVISSVA